MRYAVYVVVVEDNNDGVNGLAQVSSTFEELKGDIEEETEAIEFLTDVAKQVGFWEQ